MKRIKIESSKPNPLFELWLEEWKKEAASRNSDLQHHFSKALGSLRKYPLPLKSGRDCIILQHFGVKLCTMLDRKLQEYKVQSRDSTSVSDEYVCASCNHVKRRDVSRRKYEKRRKSAGNGEWMRRLTELSIFKEIDVPPWNLEYYAVLVSLYNKSQDPSCSGYVFEADLLLETEELSMDSPSILISKFIDHELISMTGSPRRYSLTERGVAIAKKICEIVTVDAKLVKSLDTLREMRLQLSSTSAKTPTKTRSNNSPNNPSETLKIDRIPSVDDPITQKSIDRPEVSVEPSSKTKISEKNVSKNTEKSKTHDKEIPRKNRNKNANTKNIEQSKTNVGVQSKDPDVDTPSDVYLEPNRFDVVLLVDTQETCGGKTKPQHDATIVELTQLGVFFEVRHLKVGDFAWIARCRRTSKELILPYIAERKRIDDLSASITDGRFHEQKFRLRHSGIDNLMYIVEDYEKNYRLAIPQSSLMQASINSSVQDGFTVKYTKNHKDSMFYLSNLTRILSDVYRGKRLIGCKKERLGRTDVLNASVELMEFEEFNKAASKQKAFRVSQMFVRQLLQVKGISVEKAMAIVERYPTPRVLVEALNTTECNPELLLANIQFGHKKRLLGPALSKTVCQLYTRRDLV